MGALDLRRVCALSLLAALACTPRERPRPPGPGAEASPSPSPSPSLAPEPLRDDEYVMSYGAQKIYVYADPELEREVARLFTLFEDLRASAFPISATTQLPIGWTSIGFDVEGEHGDRLVVTEPDYDAEPERQRRQDVSVSLATLARQRRVLEQVGVAGAAINFDQHVLTIRGVLDEPEVMLIRVESPGGRMTGWRLTPAEGIEEADEIESLPVYEILSARPELLDAMLLPPGFLALYSGAQLTTVVNERNEVVWDWTVDGDEPRGRAPDLGSFGPAGPGRARPETLLPPLD